LTGDERENTNALVPGPHDSTVRFTRRSVASRVALLALPFASQAACIPLDDLSSYSSAWERQPEQVVNAIRPDASDVPDDVDSGANDGIGPLDASTPVEPELDAGDIASDAGSAPNVSDAGTGPARDDTETDAAVPDAAPSL
jgi:hypothetical protein